MKKIQHTIGGLKSNNHRLSTAIMDKNLTLRYIALKINILTNEVEDLTRVKNGIQRLSQAHALLSKMKHLDEELEIYRRKSLSEYKLSELNEEL